MFFNGNIGGLLEIVRNQTGNKRKNAAILLAKLSKEKSNLEKIRELHGIELLYSISSLVLQK
jgi:hypothetical protein